MIEAKAEEFMEAYGNDYWKARVEACEVRKLGITCGEKFLARVCLEIAKRTDFEIGLDTATRYLDDKQATYDHGPGLARNPGITPH
jgi:hypothetical protein